MISLGGVSGVQAGGALAAASMAACRAAQSEGFPLSVLNGIRLSCGPKTHA